MRNYAKKSYYIFILLAFNVVGCAAEESVDKTKVNLGINRTNLQWETSERQKEIIYEIGEIAPDSVRLSFVLPHEPAYEHIKAFNESGIDVVIFIPNGETSLYFDDGVTIREGDGGGIYTLPRFSEMNVEKFLGHYRKYLETLKEKKLKVKAIQIFNELNWCSFNGDLPMIEGGAKINEENWQQYPFVKRWAEGMRKYGRIMQGVRHITDEVFSDSPALKPQILTYGIANIWDRYVVQTNGTMIEPDFTVKILSGAHELSMDGTNIFDYADGVACHIYPDNPKLEREASIENISYYAAKMIDPLVEVVGKDKPMYITEWGVSGSWFEGFPEVDTERLQWMKYFVEALETDRFAGINFEEVMFFDYDHMPPFSIYQDGRQLDSVSFFSEVDFYTDRK